LDIASHLSQKPPKRETQHKEIQKTDFYVMEGKRILRVASKDTLQRCFLEQNKDEKYTALNKTTTTGRKSL